MTTSAKLIYLVGPSGVGKDSVLTHLKKHYITEHQPLVTHRYITRPVRLNDENHIELSEFDFQRRLNSGLFLFHWQSHGCSYAIGSEVKNWLEQGNSVIMNGSRQYLNQAREICPNLIPLWMAVSENVLRQRLQQRGRESAAEIDARIQRSLEIDNAKMPDDSTLYNDKNIYHTIAQLLSQLDSK
ncbi:MAG: ribose 1,5-bisphosphokinase [Gammaproteobacteria bacterium]|nr:ribose 1,5-bisphosphokinase [Gammaproteobacteria bacterium]